MAPMVAPRLGWRTTRACTMPSKPHVVDEGGVAEDLARQVETGAALADALELGDRLARAAAGRVDVEIDRAGERPVILAGRRAVAQDAAVANGQLVGRARQHFGRLLEEQRAHVGAGLPHRHAAELDRLAAGGVALVRRQRGVAGADGDARHRHVEFVGGDLHHRGQHALADLDAAGVDRHLAGRRERHPAREAGIVFQRTGEGGGVHARAPARIWAAAFSTARMMRLCEPQRQILSSSAAAICARVGAGFLSSSALAETMMPDRQ